MNKGKKEKIMKKLPKPWGQKEHYQFMKKTGMSEEEHEKWHKEHGGPPFRGETSLRASWHGSDAKGRSSDI